MPWNWICKMLKKQDQTIRTLEESIHQMVQVENLIELKETISKIENFLLLYTPYTKHILYYCWARLENLQHDPVFEYNKAIENFVNHYHLKE